MERPEGCVGGFIGDQRTENTSSRYYQNNTLSKITKQAIFRPVWPRTMPTAERPSEAAAQDEVLGRKRWNRAFLEEGALLRRISFRDATSQQLPRAWEVSAFSGMRALLRSPSRFALRSSFAAAMMEAWEVNAS